MTTSLFGTCSAALFTRVSERATATPQALHGLCDPGFLSIRSAEPCSPLEYEAQPDAGAACRRVACDQPRPSPFFPSKGAWRTSGARRSVGGRPADQNRA